MLDRTTTAASERGELVARGGGDDPSRSRIVIAAGSSPSLVAIWLSRYYTWAAEFPENESGRKVADAVDSFVDWFVDTFGDLADGTKDAVTYGLLNPLESCSPSPRGGWPDWPSSRWPSSSADAGRAPAIICLAGIRYLGLWHDAMITLNMTLVATLIVMVLALVFGVWMARRRASTSCSGRCSTPDRRSRRSST